MAFQADALYQAVSTAMQDLDSGARRWTWDYNDGQSDPSLQTILNLALMEVVFQRPDASAVNEAVQLDTGTKQSLSDDTILLLDVICNMGSDGSTRGRSISRTDRKTLDAIAPNWHADESGSEIKQYVYDELSNPTVWYVYPGVSADATVYVEISKSVKPTQIVAQTDPIPLSDQWFSPLYHAMLYQVFASDTGDANFQRGVHHLQVFSNKVGASGKISLSYMPKQGE